MPRAYTKEFLIDVFVSRFECLGEASCKQMRELAEKHYDEVGKDKFRIHASLDADKIKEYKTANG